jgi:hypothetical protein
MKHILALVPVLVILASGCTNRELAYDGSRPPLDPQDRIPVELTFPIGLARPAKLVYGEVEAGLAVPKEGTVKLSNSLFASNKSLSDPCDDSVADGAQCMVCYFACAPVALAGAVLILPILLVKGDLLDDKEDLAASSRRQRAWWLSRAVDDKLWASELDKAYVSGLGAALGWEVRVEPYQAPSFWSWPERKESGFGAHISRVIVLDDPHGEHVLVLCAVSGIRTSGGTLPRSFETCQRGNVEISELNDSPGARDAFRAILAERARQLSAVQAKELCPACTSLQ